MMDLSSATEPRDKLGKLLDVGDRIAYAGYTDKGDKIRAHLNIAVIEGIEPKTADHWGVEKQVFILTLRTSNGAEYVGAWAEKVVLVDIAHSY